MSEWKEFKFSDFVIINPSVKLPSKEQVSFVEMKDLVDGKRFCYPSSTRINGSGAKFQNYDTLFARITPCLENGKICQVKGLKNGCGLGSTEFLVFRGKVNTSDTDFVYYLSRWDDVRSHAEINLDGTSGRQRVPKECFNDLILKLPKNIQEQTAIASILSSLDDKIDLLHRQNATLEKIAETLFRQWFVEEAKEEWENCILEDLCTKINSGGTPSTKIESYYNGHINWYSTKELNDNYLFESISKITQDGLDNSSAKLFPKGTILIAIYAAPTVGRLGILGNHGAFNQAACGLIANESICCKEFIYLFLKNQRDELNAMASGSAQQNLNVGKIKTYPAFIPDDLSMTKFKKSVIPLFDKIEKNQIQIRTLTAMRDNLLPKLMSGEVRVEY